ncbi:MAG: acylneuraminate cytidylyltransferase family protein [Patescibacteria group bacterium]
MYEGKKVLGLILARGGSKSIPRKNIKLLGGKPLIAHTIEKAKRATTVDRIILSTDDEEIAVVGRQYGAETPFMRPKELAEDATQDFPVVIHALEWLTANENWKPDFVVHLRPTHPFRKAEHIDQGVRMLTEHPNADAVWTVGVPPVTPYKMFSVGEDGFLKPILTLEGVKEPFNMPRQKLPKAWNHYGQVDVARYETIMEKKSMNGEHILPIFLEGELVDIDTPVDWEFAEFMIAKGILL